MMKVLIPDDDDAPSEKQTEAYTILKIMNTIFLLLARVTCYCLLYNCLYVDLKNLHSLTCAIELETGVAAEADDDVDVKSLYVQQLISNIRGIFMKPRNDYASILFFFLLLVYLKQQNSP